MNSQTTLVASDVHLGAAPAENEAAFLSFLESAADYTELILNGDLFDFWFEYRTVILRRHFRTLRILSELVESGTRVRLVDGNHDGWAGSFLADEIGLELIRGPVITSVAGRRTYLAHGDGLTREERTYRLLRRVIRSRPFQFVFRNVHPDWSDLAVRAVSHTATRAQNPPADSEARRDVLTRHASDLLTGSEQLDLVIFGHSHSPLLLEVSPGRHYLNPGDWVRNCTYGVVGPDGVALNKWNPR